MTKKKSIIILTITAVIIFSAAAIFAIKALMPPRVFFNGDYPYYFEVKDMANAADVIIVADVVSAKKVEKLMVDVTPNKANKEKTPYTISTVKIVEVIKGDVSVGSEIDIKQLGDYKNKPEKTLYEMNGYLQKGTKALMFLCEYSNSPYSSVNPTQGIVNINADGELYSLNEDSLFGYSKDGEQKDKLENAIALLKTHIDTKA